MNRIRTLGWAVSRMALATLAWSLGLASAMAAGNVPPPAASNESNSYVLGYAIVLLCIGLGLTAALQSSRRSDRPKFQVLADAAAQKKAGMAPKA